jgi:hypothetical protein
VSKVCLGEVGAIFGLEISRLARSSADLSRLLELASLTDTLLIDGVFNGPLRCRPTARTMAAP